MRGFECRAQHPRCLQLLALSVYLATTGTTGLHFAFTRMRVDYAVKIANIKIQRFHVYKLQDEIVLLMQVTSFMGKVIALLPFEGTTKKNATSEKYNNSSIHSDLVSSARRMINKAELRRNLSCLSSLCPCVSLLNHYRS